MVDRRQPSLNPEQVARMRDLLLACPSVADRDSRHHTLLPLIERQLGGSLGLSSDPRSDLEVVNLIAACQRFGWERGVGALTEAVELLDGDIMPVTELRAFVDQLRAPDSLPQERKGQPRSVPASTRSLADDRSAGNPLKASYRRLRKLGLPQWASIATIIIVPLTVAGIIIPLLVRDTSQQPASGPATSAPSPSSTAPGLACGDRLDAPNVLDGAVLADGGTNVQRCFSAESPWHLEASGTDGQLCDTSVLNGMGRRLRWARGATFQVQARESGRFELHLAQHCRIVFHRGAGPPRGLPLTIPRTAQGGATSVFRSTTGFVVQSSAGCRAVVFRSFDGSLVRKVSAGARTEVLDTGLFWIETEQRDCSLTVRNA
jgi:hypothetical protein